MPAAIEIDKLSFHYGVEPVLRDVTMRVEPGSTLAIIGPNGAGKTTLVKILLGELRGYGGSVRVLGRRPRELPRLGLIGYVPQRSSASAEFPISAGHMVTLALARQRGLFRPFRQADRRAAREALEAVEAGELFDRPVGELSGGQLQRVRIARALAPGPRVLVLDEPTVGVDEAGQQRFVRLISQLKRRYDLTVVLVSHDIRAVFSMSDMIACLNVTLHSHEHPSRLDQKTLFELFQCDFEALHDHLHAKGQCLHDGTEGRA